jgi:hypothetical protein
MKRTTILAASTALLTLVAGAAPAAAEDTFPDCASAYNYGWNSSWLYVSASMNRADCDGTIVEKAEVALARAFRRKQIAPGNGEALKVCFYQGVYAGYVGALAVEYDECPDLDFGIVPSVARAAVSVFTAMHLGLDRVDGHEVDEVFDGVYWAPPGSAVACVAYIEASEAADPGRGELIDTVCRNR